MISRLRWMEKRPQSTDCLSLGGFWECLLHIAKYLIHPISWHKLSRKETKAGGEPPRWRFEMRAQGSRLRLSAVIFS